MMQRLPASFSSAVVRARGALEAQGLEGRTSTSSVGSSKVRKRSLRRTLNCHGSVPASLCPRIGAGRPVEGGGRSVHLHSGLLAT
jgi:hypothetical protein